ncbi:hypothetical protein FIU91_09830 [Roseivivax sp. THAF30]|nr:hypothetical protein FIU91_09830 [Roseivivax sp. THAF30]
MNIQSAALPQKSVNPSSPRMPAASAPAPQTPAVPFAAPPKVTAHALPAAHFGYEAALAATRPK